MARLARRFFAGAAERGVTGELAEQIFHQIYAFSDYGFPEQPQPQLRAAGLRQRVVQVLPPVGVPRRAAQGPADGLLQSAIAGRRRAPTRGDHRGPDINRIPVEATLEPHADSAGGLAVRFGLGTVRNLGCDAAAAIVDARAAGPFTSQDDLTRRVRLDTPAIEALATAGALPSWGQDCGQALWAAGAAARHHPGHLPGLAPDLDAPPLPGMTKLELAAADARATGVVEQNTWSDFRTVARASSAMLVCAMVQRSPRRRRQPPRRPHRTPSSTHPATFADSRDRGEPSVGSQE
ncbi:hypothetical protein ABZ215_30475 [Amycolatopsis sp. NPDC006131]|uniref:helix-hairpin-helix domain-containing protein n=1 Tax=Amycolatopsis sp. NPDC006131 TaxID=3156731 RepID=UPI0033ACE274